MSAPTPIFAAGPFDVLRPVARGGMAEVWLGRHRIHGTEAAIKVVRPTTDDQRLHRRLQAEVRAMAGLDHPRVAAVLDTGLLDARAEAAADGRVRAGSPWLAMAWIPHGDLRRVARPQPWSATRAVLLDVLEALAHAHARGVVHRDLKPSNVLLRVEGRGARAVLTDFGIAQVLDAFGGDPTLEQRVVGTPEYMAPEQIRAQWRDIGPWTDLYALGCLAWGLATGAPPFIGEQPFRITMRHLFEPLPPLVLGADHPPPFGAWLRRLLAKDPYARFERAADAAAALIACGPAEGSGAEALLDALDRAPAAPGPLTHEGPTRSVPGEGSSDDPAIAFDATVDGAQFEGPGWQVPPSYAKSRSRSRSRGPRPRPPPQTGPIALPDDWRGPHSRRGVVGRAGPGLFGLRTLPMVGRVEARDRLWRALRAAWRSRSPRLCLVESGAGVGRAELADWLTRRADELGAASVLRATHGPIPARRDGLGAAVRAWFRAAGDDAILAARVDAELERRAPDAEPEERRATREALVTLACRGVVERHGQYEEQVRAMARWLWWTGARRPVILRLDDVHHSAPSMAMATRLLEQTDLPLVVLVTLPVAAERAHVGAERLAALEALHAAERLDRITLGPLDEAGMATLLVGGVGLDPALAARLAGSARGNPLFAVQVIAEWLADGALRPGPRGMTPSDGRAPPIPAGAQALGRARLARAIASADLDPDVCWPALEAAAALGEAVGADDWASVTGAPRTTLTALAGALLDAGLARPADGGWSFAHAFTRRALLAQARDGERLGRLALYCALAVLDPDPADPGPAERRARYLLDGGHPDPAIAACTEAARRAAARGGYRAASTLLGMADAACAAAELAPDDLRRGRLLAIRAEVARFTGRAAQAEAAIAALRALPRPPDHPWARAEVRRLDAQQAFFAGDTQAALTAWTEAETLFEAARDDEGVARCLHGQGWALASQGHLDPAEDRFARARRIAEAAGLEVQAAWCLQGLAVTRIWGHHPDGLALISEAADRFARLGQPAGQGMCAVHLADALWAEGQPARAREALDRAAHALGAIRSSLICDVLTRRAILALETGRFDAARADADAVERQWLQAFPVGHRCAPLMILAEVALRAGDLDAGRAAFDRAMARAERSLFAGPATGRLFERLADLLEATDRPRARRALTLAHGMWAPLDPDHAATLRRRLDHLPGDRDT